MNRIGKSISSLIIAGVSILLVGGALITTLAQSGFAPTPYTPPTDTAIQIPTQPGQETATFTLEPATSTPTLESLEATYTLSIFTQTATSQTPTETSATPTSGTTCNTPSTWVKYTVKSGDTLYSIAKLFQTTYQTLQVGNCMGSRTRIITGETLYVPNNATITPSPIPTKKPTAIPTKTPAPVCYALTLSYTGSGSNPAASPTNSIGCATGKYIAGEPISLTASPATGYQVDSWSGTSNDSSTSNTNSLTMPAADHAVSVSYKAICYTLSLSHTGSGSDPTASPTNSPGCAVGSYIISEPISLKASPASGYEISGWSGTNNDSSTNKTNSLTMPATDHAVSVSYKAICYKLSLSRTGKGDVPTPDISNSTGCAAEMYIVGEKINLTASGGTVIGWFGTDDNLSTNDSNTVTMPANAHDAGVNYTP